MKLVTYQQGTATRVGVVSQNMSFVYPISDFGLPYRSMNQLIEAAEPEELERLRLGAGADGTPEMARMEQVKLLAPIPVPRQDIICLGENYVDHAQEGARFQNQAFDAKKLDSIYFAKRVNQAVADGDPIPSHSDLDVQLDYEAELAVILGRDACRVSREKAGDYLFGYTIINDVSARQIQSRHKQWYRGKSLDGFCPMGPWIVTADEFSCPPVVRVQSRVNGELRQNCTTDRMIFDIPYILEELSSGMTLKRGTIISTGTPAGVGLGFTPPRFLKHGDRVECSVSGIGTLTNIVD
ncbi:MAG: fumarylacetoacetate hydrolase family protein [Candidatus Onthomonas sp.]